MYSQHSFTTLVPLLVSFVSGIVHDGSPVEGQHFDYVIIGAGPGGLVMANRLSANLDNTVAVIEAGSDQRQNSNVTDVYQYGLGLNTSIDWQYTSTPQTFAGNADGPGNPQPYNSGKGLGGTSLINGMTYIRSSKAQIDSWESALGNKGWNWDELFKCYLKTEHLQVPTSVQVASGAMYEQVANAYGGPLLVGWQQNLTRPDAYQHLKGSWNTLGYPQTTDVNDGHPSRFASWPLTLDSDHDIRWDAARAYLYPVADRPNLHIFQNTMVQRLTWRSSSNGTDAVVGGILVQSAKSADDKPLTILVDKEVILSAGSLRSPGILEASGVGNPWVLQKSSIPVKVSLPSVGENLQDQALTAIVSQTTVNTSGYPTYVTYPNANQLFGADTAAVEKRVRAQIPAYAAMIVENTARGGTTQEIQEKLLTALVDVTFQTDTPAAEILTAVQSSVAVTPFWHMLPLSRGSVHLNDADAARPIINPNFFMLDYDVAVETAAARLARSFHAQGRRDGWLVNESVPGAAVPDDASDTQWGTYEKSAYSPNHHPVGTCAMLPRELGGVVDTTLRVYGTGNVRVVDASVLPSQTVGHLTSTIYAVAERAAALMLGRSGC